MESPVVLSTGISRRWTAFDGRISMSLSSWRSVHVAQAITNGTGAALCKCQWLNVTQLVRRQLQVQNAIRDQNAANHLSGQELLETFLRERQARSDFVSKASDLLWRREVFDRDEGRLNESKEWIPELQKTQGREEDNGNGFLKLIQARRWSLGVDRAPTNAKQAVDLKRELFLMTILTGGSCSLYCAVVLSHEVCLSYVFGAMTSLLYLKLLFHHADTISMDNVAEIFLRHERKKIGIQSTDFQDYFKKTLYGSSLAVSSPRLVIPASIFGLWKILHQSSYIHFNLQVAPLMLGFFAYKGALLIQAYRDNKELKMTFPKEERES